MNDEEKKVALLSQVAELCEKSLTPIQLAMYVKALNEFSAAEVEQALHSHIKNPEGGQFMPKPADIVKMLTGGSNTQSLLAWTHVDWSIRCIGTNQSVCFEDRVINQVMIDMGGWISFGSKDYDEWPYIKNDFEKRYRGYLLSPLGKALPDKLIGAHDHTNSLEGVAEHKVRFIPCETRIALEQRKRDQGNQQSIESKISKEIEDGCEKVTSAIELCANELRENDLQYRREAH